MDWQLAGSASFFGIGLAIGWQRQPFFANQATLDWVCNLLLSIDLPYFSKHLLIASYLASFNPPKTDKRYFLKNAGKIKKKRSFRGPEVKQRLIGPLQFSMDRLIAIFEAITETQDRSISILSQLRTLVRLKLITIGWTSFKFSIL